jgi:biopolymer transport protein ExbB
MAGIYQFVGNLCYGALALDALWGAFCVVMVLMRVGQKQFRSEAQQVEFLNTLDEPLANGDFEAADAMLAGDPRAVSQLASLAIANRGIGFGKVRQLLLDRFQRDILSDLEYRLSWVVTVIKTAPMLGLLGTVLGMMGAFAKLAAAETVKPAELAENISLALITTAIGLTIAIPLLFCVATINTRIRKLEDLVAAGLTHFLESFRAAVGLPQGRRAG